MAEQSLLYLTTSMTSVLEFHIPLSREDLLRQGDRSHYVVSECCTAAEVTSRLEGTHG